MDDDAQYEKACEKIREENEALLTQFEAWLAEQNLAVKTIHQHRENMAEVWGY